MSEKQQDPNQFAHFISSAEPPVKPPPALETGALKWMRENLFSSFFNTALTVIGVLIIIYSVIGIVTWTIQDANWHAITFNMRLFMLGRFEGQYEWRVPAVLLFSTFVMGAAIAVWVKQVARTMLIASIVIAVLALSLPLIINSNVPLPSFYMAAGNTPVVLGTSNEMPIETIAFIGKEGETISIRFADDLVASDNTFINLAGFVDRATNTLRNAAQTRLDSIDRYAWLEATLSENENSEIPTLTANQVATYTAEHDAYAELAPVTETYSLNSGAVRITILDAETMQPIVEPMDLAQGQEFIAQLPQTGWFILQKQYLAPEAAITVLNIKGIYPALQSSVFSSEAGRFVASFARLTDGLRVADPLPQIDGANARFVVITENQYRGNRSFSDYLSAYLAPFLSNVGMPLVWVLLWGVIGYWVTVSIQRLFSKNAANNFAAICLALLPIVFWILVNGMYAFTALHWLLVIALGLFTRLVYEIGKRYGNSSPISYGIAALIYLALVIVLYLSHGFDLPNYFKIYTLLLEPAGLPRFILWLGIFPLLFAAYSGIQARIIGDDNKVNALLNGLLPLILFVIAAALLVSNTVTLATEWPLQPSSPNDWGGLLLVMAITIYGIIIAFPIGIALALGRRSDLPIIKAFCIGYIELVRGAPFITVLFFVQLLLPLLNAELAELTNTYRAIIATIAFSAAYLAENVRGGLQSLPPGQSEAAKALGLSAWQMTLLITMPQALRAVIPALVGQFISLFKDTSLVSIVGLSDLVKIVDTVNGQTEFSGTRLEGLFFISVIYFVFSYVMGYASRVLEASGSGVTRRM